MSDPAIDKRQPLDSPTGPGPSLEKVAELGRLVAEVCHELNTPLTTARLLADALDLEPLPGAAAELARSLREELQFAERIVRDALLFVHGGPAQLSEIDAEQLIMEVLSAENYFIDAADAELTFEFERPLPPILADRYALRRALSNLIRNALDAISTNEGDRRLMVRARSEAAGPAAEFVLEVEDNGPGIPPEILPHLFEPFHTTKAIGQGTGLGLAVVREIVASHGGTIEASPASAGGAIFQIRIPVGGSGGQTREALDEDGATPPRRSARPSDGGRTSTSAAAGAPRVLVIDDEPELQRALQRILEHLGCSVTMALDGETGVRLAGEKAFDLVLCDLRLPGLHSRELLDQLRETAPEAAESIVFMTGDTITPEIQEFIASTGRPSLTKPFGRDQLEELLATIGPRQG